MARKHQPSSIDRLPAKVRELIGELRQGGCTLDEILAKLRELQVDVSRSALGRHVKGLAEVSERLRRSRDMAEALVGRFGDEPDDRVGRLNIELMHGVLLDTINAAEVDEATGETRSVTFGPQETMFLAKALKEIAGAEKVNADRMLQARREAAKEAAAAVDKAARRVEGGLSKDTIAAIKAEILGIAA